MPLTLDRMNLEILELLQEDGRRSYVDVAEEMDRAESTVRDRIQRLEDFGVIQRYTAVLDPQKLGLNGRAVVHARVPERGLQEALDGLLSVPEVTNIHHTTGEHNLGLVLSAGDMGDLERVLRRISTSASLQDVRSDVILRSVARERPLPLRKLLEEREEKDPVERLKNDE